MTLELFFRIVGNFLGLLSVVIVLWIITMALTRVFDRLIFWWKHRKEFK